MRHAWFVVLVLVVACSSSDKSDNKSKASAAPARPLAEAILGKWEVFCYTHDAKATSCPGKFSLPAVKTFRKDGTVTVAQASGKGSTMKGRYQLRGNLLVIEFRAGSRRLIEQHQARIHDDKLILWSPRRRTGSIYHRFGTPLPAPTGVRANASRAVQTLAGIRYSVDLPAGYFLAYNDREHRQRWDHKSRKKLRVHITVSPAARSADGKAAPCPRVHLSFGASSVMRDGTRRQTSATAGTCVPGTDKTIMCTVDHPRGYLRKDEKPQARRLCASLKLER